jgi:hypothetical protein
VVYWCHGYDNSGKPVCGFGRVPQDDVVTMLLRKVRETFLDPDNLRRLRAEIRRQEEQAIAPAAAADTEARAAALERQVAHARGNLALLPADMVPDAVATIRGLEADRDRLREELAQAKAGDRSAGLEAVIAAAEAWLWKLQDAAAAGDAAELSAALREMVRAVSFRWLKVPAGSRWRYVCDGGTITLNQDGGGATEPLPPGRIFLKVL